MISAADIEEELNRPNRGKRSAVQSAVLLLLSLGIFTAAGLFDVSWKSLVVLIVVLFIHESGHWLGMRFFGYRNLQMLFIPFFGAAVTGKETNVSGTRRAIVSLLGPAPGILLGIISGFIYLKWREPVFLQAGLMFILINGFNLLPIYPLDGGRFMETVIFSRHSVVEIIFKILATLAFVGLALRLSSITLGILAFVTLVATREAYYQARIVRRLKESLLGQNLPISEKIPTEQLETILPDLSIGFSPSNLKVKPLATRAESVWRRFSNQTPKFWPSMALLGAYGAFFLLAIVGAIGLTAANNPTNEKSVIVHRTIENGKTVAFEERYWNNHKVFEAQLNDQHLYDGPSTSWAKNGVRRQTGFWANGFWQGEWTSYEPNGTAKSTVTYDRGRPSKYQIFKRNEWIEVKPEAWPTPIKLGIQSVPRGAPRATEASLDSIEKK